MHRLCFAIILLAGFTAEPVIAEAPPCRSESLPPGVRAAAVPGCGERRQPSGDERLKAGRRPGVIDLGNGTEIRISGRARFEADVRR